MFNICATEDLAHNTPIQRYLSAIEEKEKDLILSLNFSEINERFKSDVGLELRELHRQAERARIAWACTTAKTQRKEARPGLSDYYYRIKQYYNYSESGLYLESVRPMPAALPDSTKKISRFSERSRYRLIRKMKQLNPELRKEQGVQKKYKFPLPYFITLTYHANYADYATSKKHLNAFLQRFRRIDSKKFAYVWKMELQERGAIHYHLAFYAPECLFPAGYKTKKQRLEYVRMRISAAWNEVSRQSENFEFWQHKTKAICGNASLYAGTNVRTVRNYNEFLGYVSKYLSKESEPPADAETGRWWASSRNLCFDAIFERVTDYANNEAYAQAATQINRLQYKQTLERLEHLARVYKNNPAGKRRLQTMLASARRMYAINQEKIAEQRPLRCTLKHDKALEVWEDFINIKRYSDFISVN